MNTNDIHDLVAPYALDALDEGERAAFEAHLATCDRCTAELAELSDGAALLAADAADDVPEMMRRRVFAAIEDTPQVSATPGVASPDQASRLRRWTAVAVAAVIIAAVAIGGFITRSGLDANDIITAADATRYELLVTDALSAAPGVNVDFFYSPGRDAGVIRATGLPEVGEDQTYQAWLVGDGDPIPSGLFRPSGGDATLIIEEGFEAAQLIAVTVEPAGGSPAPTTDVLLFADIGA